MHDSPEDRITAFLGKLRYLNYQYMNVLRTDPCPIGWHRARMLVHCERLRRQTDT